MNWLRRVVNFGFRNAGWDPSIAIGARRFVGATGLAITILMGLSKAWAQGCIVARSSQPVIGPVTGFGSEEESKGSGTQRREGEGGYLGSGKWQVTLGYRHQFSFRHF